MRGRDAVDSTALYRRRAGSGDPALLTHLTCVRRHCRQDATRGQAGDRAPLVDRGSHHHRPWQRHRRVAHLAAHGLRFRRACWTLSHRSSPEEPPYDTRFEPTMRSAICPWRRQHHGRPVRLPPSSAHRYVLLARSRRERHWPGLQSFWRSTLLGRSD